MKKILILITILTLSFALFHIDSEANGFPYSTFTYSSARGRFVPTQDAYQPLSFSTNLGSYEGLPGETLAEINVKRNKLTLDNPEDITIDKNDNIYIANTGKKNVIKYSLQTDRATVIGDGILDLPHGVHVGIDGRVYVADLGTKKAYAFKYDENVIDEFTGELGAYVVDVIYERPDGSPYFAGDVPFEPEKIITDRGNNVYILLAGNINGLAQFENNGNFFSFFGGNQIPNTWDNVLKFILFDEEQRREWFKMIPKPVTNIAVDNDGLILTTTKTQSGYLKLNIANLVFNSSIWGFDDNVDLFVGPYDTIFAINEEGYIVEYAPDGSTLFIFSGYSNNNQLGLFSAPAGVAVDSKSNIYAINKENSELNFKGYLQVFIPTEFADLVHYAIDLYQDGKYEESLQPWQEVLEMNALFDLANKGIGNAYFSQMNYRMAMQYYEVARDRDGYSNAFWEVRNTALLSSGTGIIVTLMILFVLFIVNKFYPIFSYITQPIRWTKSKLGKYKLYQELVFPFYIFKHPGDGYYGIKREKKGSNFSATIYLLLFFMVYILWIYETSFLFNSNIPTEINIFQQMITIFVPFFLWVVANYLVCSIRDGEGKLSDVYQASSYTLLPMIITLPLLTIISQGLTFNESFIYTTVMNLGLIITGIYMVIMVKEIHFYDMKPTIGNILISIFTALMLLAVIFIIYLLLNEVYGLFADVIRELINRG